MLSVVDQFRGLEIINDLLQRGNVGIRVVKKSRELSYIRKQKGFKLVQLNERDEARVADLVGPRLFERLNA